MAKTIALVLLIVTALLAGCDGPVLVDQVHLGYEEGLHAGYADKTSKGYCDHPFPEKWAGGVMYHSTEYLRVFETGYYKGCGLARKVAPQAPAVKKPRSKPKQCVTQPTPSRSVLGSTT